MAPSDANAARLRHLAIGAYWVIVGAALTLPAIQLDVGFYAILAVPALVVILPWFIPRPVLAEFNPAYDRYREFLLFALALILLAPMAIAMVVL